MIEPCGDGRFVVHALAADGTGDDLHRTCFFGAPVADSDLAHAAASGRKQRSVPSEQALGRERRIVFFRSVKDHFDDALDVAVGRSECADIHAETARKRRAHLILVEDFAFDLARLDHFLGERAQGRFGAQLEP